MPITPPKIRPAIDTSGVLVGRVVGGKLWSAAGKLSNYLRGAGIPLIPWHSPMVFCDDEIGEHTFRYLVNPIAGRTGTDGLGGYLRFAVTLYAPDAEKVTLSVSPGTATRTLIIGAGERKTVEISALISSSGLQEVGVTVENLTINNYVRVEGICAYTLPLSAINQDTSHYGVDPGSLVAMEPIYAPAAGAGRSLGGVADALAAHDARRASILQWSAGDSEANANSSTTPADLWELPIPVLGPKAYTGDVTCPVLWSAYCALSAAGSGEVTVTTTSSGVSDTAPVTWTSYGWTAPRLIAIDCDDLNATDGRQGSSWDDLQVTIAGDGSQTLCVQSVSIWTSDNVLSLT